MEPLPCEVVGNKIRELFPNAWDLFSHPINGKRDVYGDEGRGVLMGSSDGMWCGNPIYMKISMTSDKMRSKEMSHN